MNKFELADAIVAKTGLAKKDVEMTVKTMLDVITEQLMKNDEVTLTGFGTFSAKHRSARAGVNPQNPSERIQVPAVTVPKFKAGKALKDALKGKGNGSSSGAPSAASAPTSETPAQPTM